MDSLPIVGRKIHWLPFAGAEVMVQGYSHVFLAHTYLEIRTISLESTYWMNYSLLQIRKRIATNNEVYRELVSLADENKNQAMKTRKEAPWASYLEWEKEQKKDIQFTNKTNPI